jgi:DNA gyrase/topoisomerase IV subunit B
MWKGSRTVSENSYWVLKDKKFIRQNISISEALLKCFDEILVNAIDQYIEIAGYPEEVGGDVDFIKVWFDKKTGAITITNSGKGMPVYVDDKIGKYVVEGFITVEYGGTNLEDKVNPERVTGGMNGLGMKLVNVDSNYFEVETVDFIRKKYYKQICRDRMEVIEEPRIVNLEKSEGLSTAQKKTAYYYQIYTKLR